MGIVHTNAVQVASIPESWSLATKPMRSTGRSQDEQCSRAVAAESVGIDASMYPRGSQIIAAYNRIRSKP